MRQETVYDILRECCAENDKNGRDNFKAQIIGSIVLANYGKKRTYRVDDVDFSTTPKSTFEWKGRTISYVEYFKEQYGIVIRDQNQPMLLSKPKVRSLINNEYLINCNLLRNVIFVAIRIACWFVWFQNCYRQLVRI